MNKKPATLTTVPLGYSFNASGHLVPTDLISEIDLTRDALVLEIVEKVRDLRELIADFKEDTLADIGAFVELSAEKYGVKLGGVKGNLTLCSFDGQYQIKLIQADIKIFDERIHAAKELKTGHDANEALVEELRQFIGHEVGPIAKPEKINFVPSLPKTRSGKIMRRVLKARARGMDEGDLSTLEE